MRSPLEPTMANVFLSFYEIKRLVKPVFTVFLCLNQIFAEDILMTFLFSSNPLITSRNFVIILILVTCLSPLNRRKMESCHFLIEVFREKGKFVTTVYTNPTFSGVFTHFESFLVTIYKFGKVYILAYRCFKICSDWTKFPEELSYLKQVFL